MRNRTTQSALVVAGVAAGAVAAALLGKRRLSHVKTGRDSLSEPRGDALSERESVVLPVGTSRDSLIEPESAELPVGRSADPAIDAALSRKLLPQDETSGASLLGGSDSFADESTTDAPLDEAWSSLPGMAEGEQTEGYDAVAPEDMGAVWLERATQTTHEARPHASDPNDVPELGSLLVSEATLSSAGIAEDGDAEQERTGSPLADDEEDDEEAESQRIAEDELG